MNLPHGLEVSKEGMTVHGERSPHPPTLFLSENAEGKK